MTDSNGQFGIPQFSNDEWNRMHMRDNYVKRNMAERISALLMENLELMAIVQEMQGTIASLQEGAAIVNAEQLLRTGPEPPPVSE